MFKATSTYSQAKNIALALTMTFAATTLTACGSDEGTGTDATQSPEAEMATENQNDTMENTSQTETDTATEEESETMAESEETSDTMTETEDSSSADSSSDESTAASTEDASDAEPESHAVTAQGLKYNPLVVKINPGDTVVWRNMNTHNTESLEGLIPADAEMWKSAIGDNYRRTFTLEGIYVYKCTPHFGAGMGGAIIVGEPVNLAEIKNADVSGAAGRLVRKAVSEAETM
jgi:pseudoazurin